MTDPPAQHEPPAPPSPHDGYVSPLAGRYASAEMQRLWSARHKYQTWRRIWLAVAKAQHEMGLPVSAEQVAELEANLDVTDEDIARAAEYEADLRHDVMSHVHAWGDRCPTAKGIIHLGMTSQDVNDNCELLVLDAAVESVERRIDALAGALGDAARTWSRLPTLGFTHYQPAQPTTLGRRIAQWAADLVQAHASFFALHHGESVPLRGLRGATGTQASYLALFDDDPGRVARFESLAIWDLRDATAETGPGHPANIDEWMRDTQEIRDETRTMLPKEEWPPWADDRVDEREYVEAETFGPMGQTYPRVFDAQVVTTLANICAVLHKTATDIRLLSNRKELDEPFASKQIGSSAMPYKRTPMRCERVCGLARFVMHLVGNAYETAATQWLERPLDDSSNRRLTLPEAFLATDACLGIMHNVISGLVVHEATIRKNLMAELPFMASENLMMEAVKLGRDRQEVHEAIRRHAQAAGARVKDEGAENDLIDRLRAEPLLEGVDLDAAMDPMRYVGLAVEQTERFVRDVIDPLRNTVAFPDDSRPPDDLRV